MKVDIYDFRRYRNPFCLVHAIVDYCDGRNTRTGMKGICPRQSCRQKSSHTLKCSRNSKISYCHACHCALDALQIIAEATGCGLRTACEMIQLLGEDY